MIQIINGFKINSDNPIDSRIIVDVAATRLAIQYKYHGLRVWQTDTNTPYFWDGTAWKSELDLVVTGVDGVVSGGTVPVFDSSNPVKIRDSIISATPDLVTINGDLSFDSITSGSIDADFINTGTMLVSRLQKGNPGQVLQTVGTVVQWRNLTDLTIGKSTNSDKSEELKIKTINLSNTYQLVLRNISSTISTGGNYVSLHSHVNGLKFKDDGNGLRILAHNGSSDNPPYSFFDSPTTGMYSPSSNTISFSTNGTERVRIDSNTISFSTNGTERVRIDNSGLKTIFGTKENPSHSWIGADASKSGMFRHALHQIGFSTNGNTNLVIYNGYSVFGDPFIPFQYSPRIKSGGGSVESPSYSWELNTNTGIYRPANNEIGFSTGGFLNLVIGNGFVTFGNNITAGDPRIRTGNNTSPTSPSFTWYDNDQTGIYRPEQDVIGFSTSGVLRLKIEDDGTTVNNNFYLPSPNGSTPAAGKILTAVDGMGKSEWSSPSSLVEAGFYGIVHSAGPNLSVFDFKNFSTWGLDTYINPFTVPFTGYYQITISIHIRIDFDESSNPNDAAREAAFVIYTMKNVTTPLNGVYGGIKAKGMENVDGMDRFYQSYTSTWAGELEQGDEINIKIERESYSKLNSLEFKYKNTSDTVGSHLSWIGIKA